MNSRGFGFITYNDPKYAIEFMKKDHYYDGNKLDCKLSLDHKEYIKTCLKNIRYPKKIFVDKIPKDATKESLKEIFSQFGEVEEVIVIYKPKRPLDFGYINFFETESALAAKNKGKVECPGGSHIDIKLSRPKFSKKMLTHVPQKMKAYIKGVQKGHFEYSPADFAKIEDQVIKNLTEKAVHDKSKGHHTLKYDHSFDYSSGNSEGKVQTKHTMSDCKKGGYSAQKQHGNLMRNPNMVDHQNFANDSTNLLKNNLFSTNYYSKNTDTRHEYNQMMQAEQKPQNGNFSHNFNGVNKSGFMDPSMQAQKFTHDQYGDQNSGQNVRLIPVYEEQRQAYNNYGGYPPNSYTQGQSGYKPMHQMYPNQGHMYMHPQKNGGNFNQGKFFF